MLKLSQCLASRSFFRLSPVRVPWSCLIILSFSDMTKYFRLIHLLFQA